MGSKLPCQFCGLDSGLFGGRTMYRCTNCGTVLCRDHIDEKLLIGKLLFAWSPIAILIVYSILCTSMSCNIREIISKDAFVAISMIIVFIVQPIFWGTINWTKRKCFKCGTENTLKQI